SGRVGGPRWNPPDKTRAHDTTSSLLCKVDGDGTRGPRSHVTSSHAHPLCGRRVGPLRRDAVVRLFRAVARSERGCALAEPPPAAPPHALSSREHGGDRARTRVRV